MRKSVLLSVALSVFLVLNVTGTALAAVPVPNGDFEAGAFAPWIVGGGVNGGTAQLVEEGTCWSANTTLGITFSGDFAASLRSSDAAPTSSVGVLTSAAFVARSSVRFKVLSETRDGRPEADPVELIVRILDASDGGGPGGEGSILKSREITDENVIRLDDSVQCASGTGESRDMPFSTHSIDTSAITGRSVKIQFRQHTNAAGDGFFTLIDEVAIVGDVDATVTISPPTIFPVIDGYKDELIIKGERNVAASVDISIRAASDGSLVREAGIVSATGPYRWTWDGHGTNGATGPAALLPAGHYDVTVILTDDASDTKTVEKRVGLGHNGVTWGKRRVVKRKGRDYTLLALDKNASISPGASQYDGGVRLISRKGFAAVVYVFPVKKKSGKVLDVIHFKVVGRSANRHKAVMAVYNKRLGGFLDLSNYDAAKLIGPGFKTWKTTASPGEDHVKGGNERARATVMTWKGLGRSGRSVFDIKKVILTYRVGTLQVPAGTAASRRLLADAISKSQPRTRRSVADVAGARDLPKAAIREDPPTLDGDSPSEESAPSPATVESAPPDEDSEGQTTTPAKLEEAETPNPEPEPVEKDDPPTAEAPPTAGSGGSA